MSARRPGPSRRFPRAALAAAALGAALTGFLLHGCTNDPFDPASVPNQPPVARIFVGSIEGDTLNATSYYHRTFHWSGSDEDGRVVEFYVSLETQRGVPAPWDTTTRTDTTMTFTTDDEGHAEVTIRVACRDDRGALSDTVSQYIPLRNFPPVLNFQADFDTVRWSYGAASFRFFALDLDGNETMDDSLLYRLDTADTNIVRAVGTPGADPAACWVKKPFDNQEDRTFNVALTGTPPGERRTLTVSVSDEARAETRLQWSWKVLAAHGPVLLVADAGPTSYGNFYRPAMDQIFGEGAWSLYNLGSPLVARDQAAQHPELYYIGLPDQLWVLRETFRQFPVVIWYTGGSASLNLKSGVTPLTQYLIPSDLDLAHGVTAGRLLLACKTVVGAATNLPPGFATNVLGLSTTAAPASDFNVPIGKRALGQKTGLPTFTSIDGFNRQGLGVTPRTGTDTLYKLEYYEYSLRPPYEPVVGTRVPSVATAPLARAVVLTVQLEYFNASEATAALGALLQGELGVTAP